MAPIKVKLEPAGVREYKGVNEDASLRAFMQASAAALRQNGRIRTAETYTAALSSFLKFLRETSGQEDMALPSINSETMEAYAAWLRRRNAALNTVSFYARILRATYNRAVDKGLTDDRHPFRHVYTGVDKTIKRALPLGMIKRIKTLDLSRSPSLDYARDMFLLSFYLRGMSFIDMAFLRKSDLRHGTLTYRRRKTGQHLVINWIKEMQTIVDKYPRNPTCYLLPIIRSESANERSAYRNTAYNINYNLKKIARMLNLTTPLTLYVARHSWASAARAKGIPLSVISEGMGHDSEATTRIYLASLDNSAVDRANAIIAASI